MLNFPKDNYPEDDLQGIEELLDKIEEPKELLKEFDKYQPLNKDIDVVTLKQSQFVKVKKYKGGSVFFGEFMNNKRHGKGI